MWLLANWKLVAIGILSLALALTFKLWRGEVKEFAMFKAQVEVLGKQAEAEKKRIETEHAKVTKEIGDAWAKNLDAVRNNAVARYRMRDNPGRGFMPGLTLRPKEPDGASKERLACNPDEAFIADAAEDAAKVGAWQDWARSLNLHLARSLNLPVK